jgi:hypothetical protein
MVKIIIINNFLIQFKVHHPALDKKVELEKTSICFSILSIKQQNIKPDYLEEDSRFVQLRTKTPDPGTATNRTRSGPSSRPAMSKC